MESSTTEQTRWPMGKTIVSGFPLRRCSWIFDPIVSIALRRRMIRWLDAVCLPTKRRKRNSPPGSEYA
jgi:hypothetical protein